jgi:hypothetical protein
MALRSLIGAGVSYYVAPKERTMKETLAELFRWHPWPGPDPALTLLVEKELIDKAALLEIVAIQAEVQKQVMAAQAAGAERIQAVLARSAR